MSNTEVGNWHRFSRARVLTSQIFCNVRSARLNNENVEQIGPCHKQGAADVSSAELFSDFSAGKIPAAPCASWKASFRFFECIGTMNCPAAVAQASSPASLPGVSPGVRAGGETPPQLAAGTAALRGSWRTRIGGQFEVRNFNSSSCSRSLSDSSNPSGISDFSLFLR